MAEMRNFQNTFGTYKRSFISAFSIFMTVPLNSSLAIQSHLLTFRFLTEVMLSDKWCSMLFIVISLSDTVWI